MDVLILHSSLGLRGPERRLAAMLQRDDHAVNLPDLYQGRTASDLEGGLNLMRDVGWPAITRRAEEALADSPADTAIGFSMGVGVAGLL